MRNLKKILALVLALMMVLSMMVTASAADFVDNDDIDSKYAEAVEVMAALGVLAGSPAGEEGEFAFNPKGILNRGQAAVILSVVMNGSRDEIADLVDGLDNPFSDVPAWAEPFVIYAYNKGVTIGVGGGKYGTMNNLTGFDFGKMLLVAAGIKESADFTAENYKLVVSTTLKEAKLLKNMAEDFSLADPLTREAACQLAFDVIQYTTDVHYTVAFSGHANNAIANILVKDQKFDTMVDAINYARSAYTNPVLVNEFTNSGTDAAPVYTAGEFIITEVKEGSLAKEVFGLGAAEAKTDDFGRVTKVWSASKPKSVKVTLANDSTPTKFVATATTTTINSKDTLLAAVKAVLNNSSLQADSGLTMWINGEKLDTPANIEAGDSVEVYFKSGKLVKVIVIREELVTVDSISPEKMPSNHTYKNKYEYTLSNGGKAYASSNTAYTKSTVGNTVNYIAIMDKNDVAMSLVAPTNTISNAKITGSDNETLASASYIVVNGNKAILAKSFADKVDGGMKYGVAYDYILNSNGYVLAVAALGEVETEEADWGYAWLLAAEKKITAADATTGSLIGGSDYSWDITAVAKLAFVDGTTSIINLPVEVEVDEETGKVTEAVVNGTVTYTGDDLKNDIAPVSLISASGIMNFAAEDARFVKYTIMEDGSYKLEKVTGTEDIVLAKGSAAIEDSAKAEIATSATTWTVYTYDLDNKTLGVTEVTGIANFVDGTYASFVTPVKDTEIAKSIVTFATYEADKTTKTDYAYYVGQGAYDGVVKSYAHKFYINGEAVEYFIDEDATVTTLIEGNKGKAFDLTLVDGAITVATVATPGYAAESAEVTLIDETFIIAGGETLYLAEDCVIYNVVSGNGAADTLTAETTTHDGDLISYIKVGGTGENADQIALIYIVKDAAKKAS